MAANDGRHATLEKMIKQHSQIFVLLMAGLDLAVTAAAWAGCYWLRFQSGWFEFKEASPPALSEVYDILVIILLLTLLVFGWFGMYLPRRTQTIAVECLDLIRACLSVWILEVALSYFLRSTFVSRKLQFMFLVAWPTMLIAFRVSIRLALRSLRRHGRNLRTVAVVGAGRLAQKLVYAIRNQPWTGYEVLYFVEDHRVGERRMGLPVHGPIAEIERVLRDLPVDAVMVALPQERSGQLADVLNRLSGSLVDVNVVPDLLSYQFLRHRAHQIGMLNVVNLTHSPQSGWNAVVKRLFDLIMAAAALAVLAPLMIAIALLVRFTSAGGVFYLQRRASLGGKEFDILKFRSMVRDAEGAAGAVWAEKRDPRVTRVGRFLRKYSLDELPQLLNVLKGDMSLVGPRPERPQFIERFSRQVPRYVLRHHVKAGLTGWAQVNGYRGMTSLRKRIQYDLDYINRWSFGFDLYIILLTVFRGFISKQE